MQRQYVGIDLHRRRSVIVRRTPEGETLETVRIENDPVGLAWLWPHRSTPTLQRRRDDRHPSFGVAAPDRTRDLETALRVPSPIEEEGLTKRTKQVARMKP